jgi:glucose-1-phosphate cytidylyltransferase
VKVVILAGGLGTRLAEETEVRPKPMVEIGGRPILWHIMKHFAHHGFDEFVVALGYRGDMVKRYFVDAVTLGADITVDLARGEVTHHARERDPWIVHLVDTGAATNTGGRLGRLQRLLGSEPFLLTYGDGVGDVDLGALLRFHRAHGKVATITAVRPPARYGGLYFEGPLVNRFTEKPQAGEGWINGGFMVFEPGIFRWVGGDEQSLEVDVLERLAREGQLGAYRHDRFWQCMDTLRDKRALESLWQDGLAPWRVWQ